LEFKEIVEIFIRNAEVELEKIESAPKWSLNWFWFEAATQIERFCCWHASRCVLDDFAPIFSLIFSMILL
jgi:hypothetical protein